MQINTQQMLQIAIEEDFTLISIKHHYLDGDISMEVGMIMFIILHYSLLIQQMLPWYAMMQLRISIKKLFIDTNNLKISQHC
jgi:hypothetical protein